LTWQEGPATRCGRWDWIGDGGQVGKQIDRWEPHDPGSSCLLQTIGALQHDRAYRENAGALAETLRTVRPYPLRGEHCAGQPSVQVVRPAIALQAHAATKENGSSWIFEPLLTWANALRRVQSSGFALGNPRAAAMEGSPPGPPVDRRGQTSAGAGRSKESRGIQQTRHRHGAVGAGPHGRQAKQQARVTFHSDWVAVRYGMLAERADTTATGPWPGS
jgi:hypothetical protein